jgi:hypothetical protein
MSLHALQFDVDPLRRLHRAPTGAVPLQDLDLDLFIDLDALDDQKHTAGLGSRSSHLPVGRFSDRRHQPILALCIFVGGQRRRSVRQQADLQRPPGFGSPKPYRLRQPDKSLGLRPRSSLMCSFSEYAPFNCTPCSIIAIASWLLPRADEYSSLPIGSGATPPSPRVFARA